MPSLMGRIAIHPAPNFRASAGLESSGIASQSLAVQTRSLHLRSLIRKSPRNSGSSGVFLIRERRERMMSTN